MSSALDIRDQGVRFRGTVERPALVHYGHRGLKATLAPHWAVPPIGSSACAGAHVQYKYKYKHKNRFVCDLCGTNTDLCVICVVQIVNKSLVCGKWIWYQYELGDQLRHRQMW